MNSKNIFSKNFLHPCKMLNSCLANSKAAFSDLGIGFWVINISGTNKIAADWKSWKNN